jgi:hypothetical protein|tara:strand:+ start:468 stop:692 length:225 start_codon:yes stop_codon:yes gene_type:complete
MTLYDKLKPHIKNKLEESSKEYTTVEFVFDKLKSTDYYSDLTIDDIRSICTFGDVWHHDLTQTQLIYGDWLTNK